MSRADTAPETRAEDQTKNEDSPKERRATEQRGAQGIGPIRPADTLNLKRRPPDKPRDVQGWVGFRSAADARGQEQRGDMIRSQPAVQKLSAKGGIRDSAIWCRTSVPKEWGES